jgi:hypothetical protein
MVDLRNEPNPPFLHFAGRVVACHVVTYLVCGLVASNLLDYASRWQDPLFAFMRPLDSPWVALGPALQVVRGLESSSRHWTEIHRSRNRRCDRAFFDRRKRPMGL